MKYQYQGVRQKLMFAQRGEKGDDEVEKKEDKQNPQINRDHTICNNCGEKGHYTGNSE